MGRQLWQEPQVHHWRSLRKLKSWVYWEEWNLLSWEDELEMATGVHHGR
jgi:hypothetical protein